MNVLVIDTSANSLLTAIVRQGVVYAHRIEQQVHAEVILPEINNCIEQAAIALSDINLIAVCNGPGSFIGVRTGLTVAKTLAFALDIPVIGVSSLAALAQSYYAASGCDDVYICMDARMRAAYCGHYKLAGHIMEPASEDSVLSIADVIKELDNSPKNLTIIGNARAAYEQLQQISQQWGNCNAASAEAIATLALEYYKTKQNIMNSDCKANYVRNKVAQTKQERGLNG
jgi:tRNA threonylcarbamoyladenosine biosynthesis protein TsaB